MHYLIKTESHMNELLLLSFFYRKNNKGLEELINFHKVILLFLITESLIWLQRLFS